MLTLIKRRHVPGAGQTLSLLSFLVSSRNPSEDTEGQRSRCCVQGPTGGQRHCPNWLLVLPQGKRSILSTACFCRSAHRPGVG